MFNSFILKMCGLHKYNDMLYFSNEIWEIPFFNIDRFRMRVQFN